MIGIDILEISRIEKLYSQAFLNKVFSIEEQQYINSKPNAIESACGMYCAKEAVVKALGCGIGNGVGFHSIVITHDSNGSPQVKLDEKCQEILSSFNCSQVFLSISHNNSTAVAVAVLK